eukprot:841641-Amphidinium_carterae.1
MRTQKPNPQGVCVMLRMAASPVPAMQTAWHRSSVSRLFIYLSRRPGRMLLPELPWILLPAAMQRIISCKSGSQKAPTDHGCTERVKHKHQLILQQ